MTDKPGFDYTHGSEVEFDGKRATAFEIVETYQGRKLLTIHAELYEHKSQSRFLILVPGFLLEKHYKKDERGRDISRLERVPYNLRDLIKAFLKEGGIEKNVVFH